MRVLVTGAAGFIGSHLSENLLAAGHDVLGLDDVSTGSAHNIVHLLSHPNFTFVRGSVLDRDLVTDLAQDRTHIFHLAAAVGVHTIVDDPLTSLRTNMSGTEFVLEAALRFDARVLITSTSEVYGKNDSGPLHEDADRILGSALKSRWSYASAKALDELIAYTYWRDHGLRAVIVRLFNTVGPRQTGRYGMVVPRFVEQALAGDDLTVVGSGDQRRCFCHVADIVPALAQLIDNPRVYGEVFNLGNPQETTIEALANLVVEMTGSSSAVEHVPAERVYGPGFEDMQRRVPDITKARTLIGFEPQRQLSDIIDDVIDERRRLAGVASRFLAPVPGSGAPTAAIGAEVPGGSVTFNGSHASVAGGSR